MEAKSITTDEPVFSVLLTVLLPVYNSEQYITQAIASILNQSFTDFELILINDCSTDATPSKIAAFQDPRIIYLENAENKGLIYTLNRGILLARGKYIARMDADDICLPERFARQVRWLENHPETSIVGTHVQFIDERDRPAGVWKNDLRTTSYKSIKRQLLIENCMAHPSVMGVTACFKQHLYDHKQKHIEDYDLWLRIIAAGQIIEKVPETLLLYRVHAHSVTGSHLKLQNPFLKNFHCKRVFLARQLQKGRFNRFIALIVISMAADGVKAMLKELLKALKPKVAQARIRPTPDESKI